MKKVIDSPKLLAALKKFILSEEVPFNQLDWIRAYAAYMNVTTYVAIKAFADWLQARPNFKDCESALELSQLFMLCDCFGHDENAFLKEVHIDLTKRSNSHKEVEEVIQTKYPKVNLSYNVEDRYYHIYSEDDETSLRIAGLYQSGIYVSALHDLTLEQWMQEVEDLFTEKHKPADSY